MPRKKPTVEAHSSRAEVTTQTPPATKPPSIPSPTPWHFLTLPEWCEMPDRVYWLRSLFATEEFRVFLGMLHNQARYGSVEGMPGRLEVLSWIETAATPTTTLDNIPVTYGVPEPPPGPPHDDDPLAP